MPVWFDPVMHDADRWIIAVRYGLNADLAFEGRIHVVNQFSDGLVENLDMKDFIIIWTNSSLGCLAWPSDCPKTGPV